ncbi:mitochondrial carrier domain-containing protein [Pterulicium gracile]|uniref:Mitochondrial carrier domain-containing protein n=1 Tax=Pterulicium gracile TaxID=1884261 RepID=A0A5C3Q6J8_9AGAR|nr:mitochondrial carrier domain-containing protein [Pterula gracilis]
MSQTNKDRQPLLSTEAPLPSYSTDVARTENDDQVVDGTEAGQVPQDVKEQRTKSNNWLLVLWLGLFIAALVVIVLFIIGFLRSANQDFDLKKALKRALGGGVSGAAAMVIQVLTLMPVRTVMNYQYRYGTTTKQAAKTLYTMGGFRRYYQGLLAALIQGPTSRFGDTAANAGILALLESNEYVREKMPSFIKTAFAALAAALFRMLLTPVDTIKTTMQTQGARGMEILRERVKMHGIGSLFWGAFATAAATFVGYYPWFGTHNFLIKTIPLPTPHRLSTLPLTLLRLALIGFTASCVSDTISNSLRVVKTYRQTNDSRIGYVEAAKAVVEVDGWRGLFGRGLKTRILANGLQGMMFAVLWNLFMEMWNKKAEEHGGR